MRQTELKLVGTWKLQWHKVVSFEIIHISDIKPIIQYRKEEDGIRKPVGMILFIRFYLGPFLSLLAKIRVLI